MTTGLSIGPEHGAPREEDFVQSHSADAVDLLCSAQGGGRACDRYAAGGAGSAR